MKTILFLALVIVGAFCDSDDTYHRDIVLNGKLYHRVVQGKHGQPKFLAGDSMGRVSGQNYQEYIFTELKEVLNLVGTETFEVVRSESDFRNNQHIVFQQRNRGLEVDGGDMIIHMRNDSTVFAVTSSVLPDSLSAKPRFVDAKDLMMRALRTTKKAQIRLSSEARLCFFLFEDYGHLVYRALVTYFDQADNITKREYAYVGANTGLLLFENSLFQPALDRDVYTANQGTRLPGTLARTEGQKATTDTYVNSGYDNSGICYNFYKASFNRDSIDNKGATLISTVHYSVSYNNAFWDGVQMVYGDGDGRTFSNFAGDLSVVCHELTHAVTTYSANLRYQGESGALNEAMSDIFGAASTVYRDGGGIGKDTWHIGADCYLAGVALRYMDNPILDGVSYDWYPTRYKGTSDNGGVHWNSGIANLAFVLMTQGGVHPQQKSNVWVEEIGIGSAQQIFYSALTQYMTTSTTFSGARAFTETAAKVLYDDKTELTVSNAWDAVGVV